MALPNAYGHLQDIKYPQSLVQNRFQTGNDPSYHQGNRPQPPRSSTTPIAAISVVDQEQTSGSNKLHQEAITNRPTSVSVENIIKEILGNNEGGRITYSTNKYYQAPSYSSYPNTDSIHSLPTSLMASNTSRDRLTRPETGQASPLDLSLKKSAAEATPCEGLAARMDAVPLTSCRNIRDPRLYISTRTYGQNSHHLYAHPDTHKNYMQSLRQQHSMGHHHHHHHQAVQVTEYHHHHLPQSHHDQLAVTPRSRSVTELNNNDMLERVKKRGLGQDGLREFGGKERHQHLPPPPPHFVGTGISGFSHLRLHGSDPSEQFMYLHQGTQFRPLQMPPDHHHAFPVVTSNMAMNFHETGRSTDFRKYSPPIVTDHYSRFHDRLSTYTDRQHRDVPRRPWSDNEEKREKSSRDHFNHQHQFRLRDPDPDNEVEPLQIQIPPLLSSQKQRSSDGTSSKDTTKTGSSISKSATRIAATKISTSTSSNELYSPSMPILTPNDEQNSQSLNQTVSPSPVPSTGFPNSCPPKLVNNKNGGIKKPNSWEEIRSKGTRKIGDITSGRIREEQSNQREKNCKILENNKTNGSHKEQIDYRNLPSKKRSYYRNFTEDNQNGIDTLGKSKNDLEQHYQSELFSKEAIGAQLESPRSSHSESDCMSSDRDHKSNTSREISRLRNTEGYIGDRLKTCEDLVDVDSSQLNREERAIQRALLRFNEMEKRGEKRLSIKPITKKMGDSEILSDTDMAWERMSEIKEIELTKGSFSESEATDLNSENLVIQNRFKNFVPNVIQTRTRNGRRLSTEPLYNKDAKYEEEVEKEEQKKLFRKSLKEAAGLLEPAVSTAAATPVIANAKPSIDKKPTKISNEQENKLVLINQKNNHELSNQTKIIPSQKIEETELPAKKMATDATYQKQELVNDTIQLKKEETNESAATIQLKKEETNESTATIQLKKEEPNESTATIQLKKEETNESTAPIVTKKRMVGRPPKKKRFQAQNSPASTIATKTNSKSTIQSEPLKETLPVKTRRCSHLKEKPINNPLDESAATASELVTLNYSASSPSQEAHNFSPQSSMRCIINPKNYNKIRFVNNDNSQADPGSDKPPRKSTGNRPGRPVGSTGKAKCGRKRKLKTHELATKKSDFLNPAESQELLHLIPLQKNDEKFEIFEPAFPMPLEMKRLMVNKTSGETALHRAARLGYDTVASYCIKTSEVDVNAKDNAGFTPLHECCVRGRLEIAQLLLTYGANPNACSVDGIRPIHDAIENDHIEVVRLLLSYGADPLLATYSGRTPLKIARSKEMKILVRGYIYDLNGYIPEEESEKENKENKKTKEKQIDEVKIYWEFRGSCSLFDKEEEVGFDIFANIPSWEEDTEDNDLAGLEIEMSETPQLTAYNLLLDESKRKENYSSLEDVLKSKRIKERELTGKLGIPVEKVPKEVFKSQLTSSQVVELGMKERLTNGSSPTRNDFIKLVQVNSDLRKLLNVETVNVGSQASRPPLAQGLSVGAHLPLSMPSRKMGRGRGRRKLEPARIRDKKLNNKPLTPKADSRDVKKIEKPVATITGPKKTPGRGRPSHSSKKLLSHIEQQQQQPATRAPPTNGKKGPVGRPVGRPHRAKRPSCGRLPNSAKQKTLASASLQDHQSVEKFIPTKPSKRAATTTLSTSDLPTKRMKKSVHSSERSRSNQLAGSATNPSKVFSSTGRSLRAKSTPTKKRESPNSSLSQRKKNLALPPSNDVSQQPAMVRASQASSTKGATPAFFLDKSQPGSEGQSEGLGHQLLSANYNSQLMVPPQVSGYVC